MMKFREDEEMPPLDCIGSCGLHVISGVLQSGVKAAEWGTEKVLWVCTSSFINLLEGVQTA